MQRNNNYHYTKTRFPDQWWTIAYVGNKTGFKKLISIRGEVPSIKLVQLKTNLCHSVLIKANDLKGA